MARGLSRTGPADEQHVLTVAPRRAPDRRRGVALGYHGETASLEELARMFRAWDGDGQWEPMRLRQGGYDAFAVVRRKVDVGPSLISRVFDCRGPSIGIASACAAGGQAIGEAYRLITAGPAAALITR